MAYSSATFYSHFYFFSDRVSAAPVSRDKGFCNPIERRGVKWPKTKAGSVSKVPCPANFLGHAEWLCSLNGTWSSGGYDLSNCVSEWSALSVHLAF